MKKTIILIALLFLITVLSLVIALLPQKKQHSILPSVFPTPTPVTIQGGGNFTPPKPIAIPTGDTITISNITVNNFFQKGTQINTQGDTLILETPGEYRLLYTPSDNQFLINITGSPFDTLRSVAEQAFLDQLGITQNQACQLNVTVGTSIEANPDQAGTTYPLSFCELQGREIQTAWDQQFNAIQQQNSALYPWENSLPLQSSKYFTYFDLERKIFVSELYPTNNATINTQVTNFKTQILSALQHVGIDTTKYQFEWHITPVSE